MRSHRVLVRSGVIAGALLGTLALASAPAMADDMSIVGVDGGNAPTATGTDPDRCVGYEGDREFIYANYPDGTRIVSVGQLYINTLHGCIG